MVFFGNPPSMENFEQEVLGNVVGELVFVGLCWCGKIGSVNTHCNNCKNMFIDCVEQYNGCDEIGEAGIICGIFGVSIVANEPVINPKSNFPIINQFLDTSEFFDCVEIYDHTYLTHLIVIVLNHTQLPKFTSNAFLLQVILITCRLIHVEK